MSCRIMHIASCHVMPYHCRLRHSIQHDSVAWHAALDSRPWYVLVYMQPYITVFFFFLCHAMAWCIILCCALMYNMLDMIYKVLHCIHYMTYVVSCVVHYTACTMHHISRTLYTMRYTPYTWYTKCYVLSFLTQTISPLLYSIVHMLYIHTTYHTLHCISYGIVSYALLCCSALQYTLTWHAMTRFSKLHGACHTFDYTRLASSSAPTWSSRCCVTACHF